MSHDKLCCGLYRGDIYLKDLSDPAGALLPVGNAELSLTQELTEITKPNFQTLGGNACSVSFVNKVGVALTLHCTSLGNLAKAFLGTASVKAGGAITGEAFTINAAEELYPFENVPKKGEAIVVKSADDVTTYIEGTDYKVTNGGIQILETTTMTFPASLKVSYTYSENLNLELLTTTQKEFYMVLDGFNAGEAGERPVVGKFWKVKLAPAENFDIIAGEEFATLELTGEILKDSSKVAGSQFGKFEWGNDEAGGY